MTADAAVAAAIAAEGLPPGYARIVDRHWRPLAARLAARHRRHGHALLIGINGVQGSGKSTLCVLLERLLTGRGLTAATLSLDDCYLTRAERAALARRVHPLFATRGVPGTHDLGLAEQTITALLGGAAAPPQASEIALPRFDKARDDRAEIHTWPRVTAPVDIVLFEGWCIGATPQPKSALAAPVNALEAAEDADLVWRSHANASLGSGYAALFARLDLLITLAAPGFDNVAAWRRQQEKRLWQQRGTGLDAAALARFIAHFERLTRHMLGGGMRPADVTIALGPRRGITGVNWSE